MLVTLQLSDFQWDSGSSDIWVLLKRLRAVTSGSQDSSLQLELARQLIAAIHLNPAAAALGQTSFLLRFLADKVSDRLWLWFSFGLHIQGSVRLLLQPTQRRPSTGERVSAISFLFEQHFGCCLWEDHSDSWSALICSQAVDSSGLST